MSARNKQNNRKNNKMAIKYLFFQPVPVLILILVNLLSAIMFTILYYFEIRREIWLIHHFDYSHRYNSIHLSHYKSEYPKIFSKSIIETKNEIVNKQIEKINGYAYYKNITEPGQLTVHLDGVPVDGPYWIVKLGEIVDNQYQYSIVTTPSGISLWVLTRDIDKFNQSFDIGLNLTKQQLSRIEELNSIDMELYEYVQKIEKR